MACINSMISTDLTHARAAKEAGLAAPDKGAQKVDDSLIPVIQDAPRRHGIAQRRPDGTARAGVRKQAKRLTASKRSPKDIQQAPETARRHGYLDHPAGIEHRHAALQSGSPVQGNGPHPGLVQVLMHFKNVALMIDRRAQGPMQGRQRMAGNVYHRP